MAKELILLLEILNINSAHMHYGKKYVTYTVII